MDIQSQEKIKRLDRFRPLSGSWRLLIVLYFHGCNPIGFSIGLETTSWSFIFNYFQNYELFESLRILATYDPLTGSNAPLNILSAVAEPPYEMQGLWGSAGRPPHDGEAVELLLGCL